MLRSKINERFMGQYDFFYLPIDLKNNCNVGYAFINFSHSEFVGEFYKEFHNKSWPKFNSEKICKITYARLQGKEECEKHFSQSMLMKYSD